jgi:hypothetical protein
MSAAEALRAAHAAGVTVMFDGEGLVLEASAEPPQSVLDALSRHKLAILDLLRPRRDGWTAEHWRAHFDKRSGIAASNNGPPRVKADAKALVCCVIEWLNQHPAPSHPGRCAWCGRLEAPGAIVLPFTASSQDHSEKKEREGGSHLMRTAAITNPKREVGRSRQQMTGCKFAPIPPD